MYKYRQNLMNSSIYTCSGYCYQASRNESGRSMVEMLGTLAIIGVLSVMGIAGYSTAMNKYRANEIMYEASMRSAIGMMQLAQGRAPNQITFSEFTNDTVAGTTFDSNAVVVGTSASQFGVKVGNVDKSVCQNLVNMAGGNVTVAKAATPTTPMTAADCSDNKEQNVLAFIYGEAQTTQANTPPDWLDTDPGQWGAGENGETRCTNSGGCYTYGANSSGSGSTWYDTAWCSFGPDSTGRGCSMTPPEGYSGGDNSFVEDNNYSEGGYCSGSNSVAGDRWCECGYIKECTPTHGEVIMGRCNIACLRTGRDQVECQQSYCSEGQVLCPGGAAGFICRDGEWKDYGSACYITSGTGTADNPYIGIDPSNRYTCQSAVRDKYCSDNGHRYYCDSGDTWVEG